MKWFKPEIKKPESVPDSASRLLVLDKVRELVQKKIPDIYLDRGTKPRLLLKWDGNDYFNFYFSNEVSDGFRRAFVLDLDTKHSQRRTIFREVLKNSTGKIEEIYGSKVLTISDKRIVAELGYKNWIKIMKHRWYSIYVMNRLEEIKSMDKPEELAKKLAPLVLDFIEKTNALLKTYPPPTA